MSAVLNEGGTPKTTLADLQRREPNEAKLPRVTAGFSDLASFELLQRASKLLMASTLVPENYRGNLPDCVIALNMAQRIGADPLMVMQNLHIVKGKPGWSSQFLIATFNQCGRFSALRYKWTGERTKDSWGCRAWAVEKGTNERIEGAEVTFKIARDEGWVEKSGSKWKTMPEQMLMYRAASWFIRAYAPEIAMGLQTSEELGDVFDAEAGPDGSFSVRSTELGAEKRPAGTLAVLEELQRKIAAVSTPEVLLAIREEIESYEWTTEDFLALSSECDVKVASLQAAKKPEQPPAGKLVDGADSTGLTIVDHIAKLATLNTLSEISEYADKMPEAMLQDDRWAKATKKRLDEINAKGKK